MSGQVLRVSTARHNACLSNHIHIHTHIHIHFCVHQNPVYVRRRESKLQKMTTPILPPRRLASHCQQSELHRPLAGPRRAAVGETTIHMPISALALWRTSFCPAAEQQQVYAEPPLLSQTPHRTCLIIVNLQAHVRILSPPYRWDTHKDCQSHPHQGFLLTQRSRLARPPLPKTQLPPCTHSASSK